MSLEKLIYSLGHHKEQARRVFVESRSTISDTAYRHYHDLHNTLDAAITKLVSLGKEPISADTLRELGWSVAIHNDYRLHGDNHTFWLFTKGGRCVKGEGKTDDEALRIALKHATTE